MSKENVELVRGIYDAYARRDDVTPYEIYAEDIVWDFSNARRAQVLTKAVYQGLEGVREFWRDVLLAFGEVSFDVEELTDAGDQVLAFVRERQVGRTSGVPVESTHSGGLDDHRRQGQSDAGVRRPPGGPQSRRAVGVAALDCHEEGPPQLARLSCQPRSGRAQRFAVSGGKRAATDEDRGIDLGGSDPV
jgi:ketosteroid isomerase-like protein